MIEGEYDLNQFLEEETSNSINIIHNEYDFVEDADIEEQGNRLTNKKRDKKDWRS